MRKSDHLPDIVREVQTEIESFHSMLEASVIAAQLQDVRISEGDQYLLYMRNLPGKCKSFFSCIRMPRQCSNFSLEFRIFIPGPEFKVTRVQFM